MLLIFFTADINVSSTTMWFCINVILKMRDMIDKYKNKAYIYEDNNHIY